MVFYLFKTFLLLKKKTIEVVMSKLDDFLIFLNFALLPLVASNVFTCNKVVSNPLYFLKLYY